MDETLACRIYLSNLQRKQTRYRKKQSNSPEDSVETWDFIIFSSDEISKTSDEISETSEKISKTSEKMIIYHEKHTESTQKGVENIA